jgi:hypothetical protein
VEKRVRVYSLSSVKKCLFEKLKFWMQRPSGMWRRVIYQTDYKFREKSLACIFIEEGQCSFFWKVGIYLLSYTASYARRPPFSYSPPWEPHILYKCSFISELSGQNFTIQTTWIQYKITQIWRLDLRPNREARSLSLVRYRKQWKLINRYWSPLKIITQFMDY